MVSREFLKRFAVKLRESRDLFCTVTAARQFLSNFDAPNWSPPLYTTMYESRRVTFARWDDVLNHAAKLADPLFIPQKAGRRGTEKEIRRAVEHALRALDCR